MKKYVLIIHSKYNTKDEFIFYNLGELFYFINKYSMEKLIDSSFAEMEYDIIRCD